MVKLWELFGKKKKREKKEKRGGISFGSNRLIYMNHKSLYINEIGMGL